MVNKQYCMVLSLTMSCMVGAENQQRSITTIPLPSKAKRVVVQLNNANENQHTISQHTIMRMESNQTMAPSMVKKTDTIFGAVLAASWRYKGTIALIAATMSYGALLGALLYMEQQITQGVGWAHWNAQMSLAELIAMPQDTSAHQLFKDIKHCYLPAEYTMLNFLDPLVLFANACEQEKVLLERFIYLHTWVASTPLHYIVPMQTETLEKAYDQIARLCYLKQLMVSRLADYSLHEIQAYGQA